MCCIALILDGITGGNNSVAQAIIVDSAEGKDRARAFGGLGAEFVLGPAFGGLLSSVCLTLPFWIASAIALFSTVVGYIWLEETNLHRETKDVFNDLFDFRSLATALTKPITGPILIISFLTFTATNNMYIGFQTHSVDVLQLSTAKVSLIFSLFGVVNVIVQGFGIKFLLKKFPNKRTLLQSSLIISSASMFAVAALGSGFAAFTICMLLFGAAMGPINPIIVSMLSERTKAEDQGGIMGLNQAYQSLAQIVGPLAAGFIAATSTSYIFIFTSVVMLLSIVPISLLKDSSKKLDL